MKPTTSIVKCMLERRSIRKYKQKQIANDELDTILLAGQYAPCAGGRQSTIIVVCQNLEINNKLGKINKAAYNDKVSTQNSFISRQQPSIADDETIISGFYDAPTVLTLFAPKNFLYGTADCSVMAQNMMLAAHSLGIGSCMVMRSEDTFASELGQNLQKQWGIEDNYQAKVHITLGYLASDLPQAKPRAENKVKRID